MISHFSRFVNPFCGKRQNRIPQGIRPHHADIRIVALRNAPRSQKERDSRTQQNPRTSQTDKQLPPCPRHLRSGILFRFFEVAGTWGKFSEGEGGLEGESPVFQEGALSLQGLSSKVFPPRPFHLPLHPAHRGADFGLQLFAALGRNVGIPVFRQKRGNAQLRMAENRRVFRQLPLFQLP